MNGRCLLEDCGSTNGTFVNGQRLRERTELRDGDRINLHEVALRYFLSDDVPLDEDATLKGPAPEFSSTQETDSDLPAFISAANPGQWKDRLQVLLEIIRRLGSSLDDENIPPSVLDLLFKMFPQTETGEIRMVDADGRLQLAAAKSARPPTASVSRAREFNPELVQDTLGAGVGAIHRDAAANGEAVEAESGVSLCAPIIDPTRNVLGVILLDTPADPPGFQDSDLELTALVGVLAGQALSYARAHRRQLEFDRSEQHLAAARTIQHRVLPACRPDIAGYRFCERYEAAEAVGGDCYFYETLPDGRVILGIADVAGKGLSAAMEMVRFSGEVRLRLAVETSLKRALGKLNRFVDDEFAFVTCCICVLDPRSHTLTVANAGHLPPLCRRRGTGVVEQLLCPQGSYPLGVSSDAEFHPVRYQLQRGDFVILYTDGVTEAMNAQGKAYGLNRPGEVIAASNLESIDDCIAELVADVDRYRGTCPRSDDLCIVGLERLL
jgi:serine phosphatase RsbU (regulator of sigma subunit)